MNLLFPLIQFQIVFLICTHCMDSEFYSENSCRGNIYGQ